MTEGVGFSDPSGIQHPDADEDEEEATEMLPSEVPAHYTMQIAQA